MLDDGKKNIHNLDDDLSLENEIEKELDEQEESKVVDENADAPEAGTPGHPGIDEGTA